MAASKSALFVLRTAARRDDRFLFELYASTRLEEVRAAGLSPARQQAFLKNQYEARREFYAATFPHAAHLVMDAGGKSIGGVIIDRAPAQITVVDLALLPEQRGLGIGSRLLRDFQAEAATAGKPLRLHVRQDNRALRLYLRLGFSPVAVNGEYLRLEWRQG